MICFFYLWYVFPSSEPISVSFCHLWAFELALENVLIYGLAFSGYSRRR
jgi:hypothetical protein